MTRPKVKVDEQEQLRALVTEMHGALKDGANLLRQMQETMGELMVISEQVFDERMDAQVQKSLDSYRDAIKEHTDNATDAVEAKFQRLYDILVGDDRENDDIPSIEDLVNLYRASQVYAVGQRVVSAATGKGMSLDDLAGLPTIHVGKEAALRLKKEKLPDD